MYFFMLCSMFGFIMCQVHCGFFPRALQLFLISNLHCSCENPILVTGTFFLSSGLLAKLECSNLQRVTASNFNDDQAFFPY